MPFDTQFCLLPPLNDSGSNISPNIFLSIALAKIILEMQEDKHKRLSQSFL